MKRVTPRLANYRKPHIYWSGYRWSVIYHFQHADQRLVNAALDFVCRRNAPGVSAFVERILISRGT